MPVDWLSVPTHEHSESAPRVGLYRRDYVLFLQPVHHLHCPQYVHPSAVFLYSAQGIVPLVCECFEPGLSDLPKFPHVSKRAATAAVIVDFTNVVMCQNNLKVLHVLCAFRKAFCYIDLREGRK